MDDTEVGEFCRLQNCDKKSSINFCITIGVSNSNQNTRASYQREQKIQINEKHQLINWLFFKRLINLNNNETMNIILSYTL